MYHHQTFPCPIILVFPKPDVTVTFGWSNTQREQEIYALYGLFAAMNTVLLYTIHGSRHCETQIRNHEQHSVEQGHSSKGEAVKIFLASVVSGVHADITLDINHRNPSLILCPSTYTEWLPTEGTTDLFTLDSLITSRLDVSATEQSEQISPFKSIRLVQQAQSSVSVLHKWRTVATRII